MARFLGHPSDFFFYFPLVLPGISSGWYETTNRFPLTPDCRSCKMAHFFIWPMTTCASLFLNASDKCCFRHLFAPMPPCSLFSLLTCPYLPVPLLISDTPCFLVLLLICHMPPQPICCPAPHLPVPLLITDRPHASLFPYLSPPYFPHSRVFPILCWAMATHASLLPYWSATYAPYSPRCSVPYLLIQPVLTGFQAAGGTLILPHPPII